MKFTGTLATSALLLGSAVGAIIKREPDTEVAAQGAKDATNDYVPCLPLDQVNGAVIGHQSDFGSYYGGCYPLTAFAGLDPATGASFLQASPAATHTFLLQSAPQITSYLRSTPQYQSYGIAGLLNGNDGLLRGLSSLLSGVLNSLLGPLLGNGGLSGVVDRLLGGVVQNGVITQGAASNVFPLIQQAATHLVIRTP
ncbi:hypothetical protein GQ53DRAFT_834162 [Thozetella sp. PMI_491]|nr:hypothetical protein GQ53DRAFT_834162 [Thozetella sp. PMI_491]